MKPLKLFIFIVFCLQPFISFSQGSLKNEQPITSIYALSGPDSARKPSYNLVKIKNPSRWFKSGLGSLVVKRLSFNYVIVKSSTVISPDDVSSIAPANALWKASDNLAMLKKGKKSSKISVQVMIRNGLPAAFLGKYGHIMHKQGQLVTMTIEANTLNALMSEDDVIFADVVRKPREEIVISDIDLSVNDASQVHADYPSLNGENIGISVKEDAFDVNDLDLLQKSIKTGIESTNISAHATIMGTLAAGRGNSFIKGLGVAPKAKLASSNFDDLLPDTITAFLNNRIFLQNHSYGTTLENYYGIEAVAYDRQVFDQDSIVHVFSSGNSGTSSPATGIYTGIAGFSNLTGNFKQAKNVLVIGGTDRTNAIEGLSSKGPAYDGRVKPEIVADGEDGTSGAAALTTGAAALVQQSFKEKFGHLPSSALVKCLLINSADKITGNEVDYLQGFGKLNTSAAVKLVKGKQFFEGVADNTAAGERFQINVPGNAAKLTVTLTWNDPPATANAVTALVNDLDLQVESPDGNTILPWVLSSYPAPDSLNRQALRQRDSLNNVEQVTLSFPAPGTYNIIVKPTKITNGSQKFYVAYDYYLTNEFHFLNPSSNSQFISGDQTFIRWKSTLADITGNLAASYDNGLTWQPIAQVTLSDNYYVWACPNVFSSVLLKMETGNQRFISAPFVISSPIALNVGFNCQNDLLLYWNRQPGATDYNIYNINKDSLQLVLSTKDTSATLPKTNVFSDYFAISAGNGSFEGVKGYTTNITTQGVGCYVRALLADVIDGTQVRLTLTLGTVTNISKIIWQRQVSGTNYADIGETSIVAGQTSYVYYDTNPKNGITYYRAVLIGTDGSIIDSDPAEVILLNANQFIVYPIPFSTDLNVLGNPGNPYELTLYNAAGKQLQQTQFQGALQTIPLPGIAPGTLILVIKIGGKIVYSGKVVKI